MHLLGQYIPERPAIVSEAPHDVAAELAQDAQRPAARSRSEFERYAQDVVNGLARLARELKGGLELDLELLIREVVEELKTARDVQQGLKRDARESEALYQDALRAGSLAHSQAVDIRRVIGEITWLRGVNERVITAHRNFRRELEGMRASRLAAYRSEWKEYLTRFEAAEPELGHDVRLIWELVGKFLWAPEAAPTDGGFHMVWDRGSHHLQIEVFRDSRYDWFYRDRDSGAVQFREDLPITDVPNDLLITVKRLADA